MYRNCFSHIRVPEIPRLAEARRIRVPAHKVEERKPDVQIIGVEPTARHHRLSGIKKISNLPEEHQPKILDYSLIDDIIEVEDHEAFEAAIRLAQADGLMVGPTTGALLHAARLTGASASGTAVVISPDDATKYISTYAAYMAGKDQDDR